MLQQLEWHYSVRKRFGETLCFFFVALGPVYERDKVIRSLNELFDREEIKARAYFEVYGEVDFIIRAWLSGTKLADFTEVLQEFLVSRGCGVVFVGQFTAAGNPYHWLFSNGPKPLARLDGENIDYLDQINVASINAALTGEDQQVVANLKALHLAKEVVPLNGIRFFVAIPYPQERLNTTLLNGLVSDIGAALQSQDRIAHATIFRGATGQHYGVLIEGLVTVENYVAINDAVNAVNAIGLQRFGVKTITYLSTEPSASRSDTGTMSSSNAIINPKDIRDVSYYLGADENEVFETKATLEIDVNRYLATGEIKQNADLVDEILETVVAFLNTEGGELLIGAVEEAKFKGEMREKLKAEWPKENALRICGVKWEFAFTKHHDFDSYREKIHNLVSDRIGRSYGPYLKVHELPYADKNLCLIRVQALPPQDAAYLGEDAFYVREGPRTIPLRGRNVDDYLRRRRRQFR